MKFSVKTEYGLRAMIYLALRNGDGLIGAKEIAARQDIPERFLEQQITALKKAGLVISQRGSSGGCSLARRANEITVLEVIEALDGLIFKSGLIAANFSCADSILGLPISGVW